MLIFNRGNTVKIEGKKQTNSSQIFLCEVNMTTNQNIPQKMLQLIKMDSTFLYIACK